MELKGRTDHSIASETAHIWDRPTSALPVRLVVAGPPLKVINTRGPRAICDGFDPLQSPDGPREFEKKTRKVAKSREVDKGRVWPRKPTDTGQFGQSRS